MKKCNIYPGRLELCGSMVALVAVCLQFYFFGLYELCVLIIIVSGILLPWFFLSKSFVIHLSHEALVVEPRLPKSLFSKRELITVANNSSYNFKFEKNSWGSSPFFIELETLIMLIAYPFFEKKLFVIYSGDKEILRVGTRAIGLPELISQMNRYRERNNRVDVN